MDPGVVIRGAKVLLPRGWAPDTDVRVYEGVIDRIGQDLAAPRAREIDGRNSVVVPGFVDLHVHGVGGDFCESARPDAIHEISRRLATFGVTGFLATIASLPKRQLADAVEAVAFAAGGETGARILGIHLEGPFLNRHCAGAQNRRSMRPPSLEELDFLMGKASGQIRMMTLAPELPGAVPLIPALRERGVVAALGHSEATEEETLLALDAGATSVTHVFNAMSSFHHRNVGLAGVALVEDRLTVEVIADGHHLSRRALQLIWRAKKGKNVALVSDSIAAALPEGTYNWGGYECVVAGGAVRLRKDGRLAGSSLTLDQAVRNLCRWLPDVPHERIFAAASATPCALLGLARLGRIEEGAEADLVILDPDYHVRCTLVRGQVVYERGDELKEQNRGSV